MGSEPIKMLSKETSSRLTIISAGIADTQQII